MTVLENAERIRDGYRIKREDKELINQLKTCDIDGLLEAADMLREHFRGDFVDLCSIIAGKSGNCGENCKFCAQSAYNHTQCEVYKLLDYETIYNEARSNESEGVQRFAIVNSGKGPTDNEFEELKSELPKSVTYEGDIQGFDSYGIYVPTLRYAVSSSGRGTDYESVNLLGKYVSEDFGEVGGITVAPLALSVPEEAADQVLAFVSVSKQFDTLLTVVDSSGSPSSTQAVLTTVDGQSTITFDSPKTSIVSGEDAVKIIYPRVDVTITNRDEASLTEETATA